MSDADETPPVITKGPVLTSVSDVQATILWETDEPSDTKIEYSLDSSYFHVDTSARETRSITDDVIDHKLTLTNLIPNTVYYYRVSSIDILNNGTNIIYIGDSTVLTTTGYPLASGESKVFDAADGCIIYGIVASGEEEARSLEGK